MSDDADEVLTIREQAIRICHVSACNPAIINLDTIAKSFGYGTEATDLALDAWQHVQSYFSTLQEADELAEELLRSGWESNA